MHVNTYTIRQPASVKRFNFYFREKFCQKRQSDVVSQVTVVLFRHSGNTCRMWRESWGTERGDLSLYKTVFVEEQSQVLPMVDGGLGSPREAHKDGSVWCTFTPVSRSACTIIRPFPLPYTFRDVSKIGVGGWIIDQFRRVPQHFPLTSVPRVTFDR